MPVFSNNDTVVLQTTRKMDIPTQVCNDTDVKIVIVHGLKIMGTVFATLTFQRTHGNLRMTTAEDFGGKWDG